QDKLPSPKEFPAPIHYWITLGLARCVAVLELARSGPQTEPLHEATLEPVVRQILAVLQTNVTILQDVGLQASMLLLHAALLIRAQPHQRQTQQHSPPTGSPSLNELYSQVSTNTKPQTAFCQK
ncbi:Huntingtin, partial [Fasciola gigantica]